MTTYGQLVPAEAALIAWLIADPAIATAFDDRIGPTIVGDTLPEARISVINPAPAVEGVLTGHLLQVDVFAVGRRQAFDAVNLIWRRAFDRDLIGAHSIDTYRITITGVEEVNIPRWFPDPETATPRYRGDLRLYARPTPGT